MWNWVHRLEKFRQAGQPLVFVTVTGTTGSTPREAGARMIVLPDKKIVGTIGGGRLEELAIQDALECFKPGPHRESPRTRRYPLGARAGQCCGGTVDLLFEPLNQNPRLYLFGAGHVGHALCRTLVGTPFSVLLIDEREEWVSSPSVPEEVLRFHGAWDDFAKQATWDGDAAARTYAAVMTHRHDLDQEIIEHLIEQPIAYIGLIGSRAKWARFQQRLTARGIAESKLARVRCPVGVDTGGKAPQEIAISIAAELLKRHYGKD